MMMLMEDIDQNDNDEEIRGKRMMKKKIINVEKRKTHFTVTIDSVSENVQKIPRIDLINQQMSKIKFSKKLFF